MANDGVTKFHNTNVCSKFSNSTDFIPEFSKYFNVLKYSEMSGDDTPGTDDTDDSYTLGVIKKNGTSNMKRLDGDNSEYYSLISNGRVIYLADGAVIAVHLYSEPPAYEENAEYHKEIKAAGGKLFESVGTLIMDVNGVQSPNVIGRDIYRFIVGDDGVLYPQGGADEAKNSAPSDYREIMWDGNDYQSTCNTQSSEGWGCAARIMEEGWQRKY